MKGQTFSSIIAWGISDRWYSSQKFLKGWDQAFKYMDCTPGLPVKVFMVPVSFVKFLFFIFVSFCILRLLAPSLVTKETSIQEGNL